MLSLSADMHLMGGLIRRTEQIRSIERQFLYALHTYGRTLLLTSSPPADINTDFQCPIGLITATFSQSPSRKPFVTVGIDGPVLPRARSIHFNLSFGIVYS